MLKSNYIFSSLGYDVPKLTQYFDWISVMTYDFHGHWDKQTGHVAPLYYYPGDTYDYFNAVSGTVMCITSFDGQTAWSLLSCHCLYHVYVCKIIFYIPRDPY